MATTWFTADTHLGHANIVKFCLRPFLTPAEEQRAREDPRGGWRVSPETVDRHDALYLPHWGLATITNDCHRLASIGAAKG